MSKMTMDNTFKKYKIVLFVAVIVIALVNSGCDYLFRGPYPDTFANTVWTSDVPEWVLTVEPDKNVASINQMVCIMVIDGEEMEFEVKFQGHSMYVIKKEQIKCGFEGTEDSWCSGSDCWFRGHGIFRKDKFIIDEIYEDRFFDFKYEEITFIRSDIQSDE